MLATVEQIVDLIEETAPLEYALESDGSGLLLGDPAAEVKRVMIALDMTEEVLREAVDVDAGMILVHHPPFFRPVQQLRYDRLPGKLLLRAVGANLALYAAHTSIDVAPGGINDILASMLGLKEVSVLAETGRERLYKVVCFVPEGHEDSVRDAMAGAGAGHIGNYSHCTFQTEGMGTFRPLKGADPYIGTVGELERVNEIRLETIVPASRKERALSAMCSVHPYEEVAFDVYPLANPGLPRGLARSGWLPESKLLGQFASDIKSCLETDGLRVAGDDDQEVLRVVVCGGRLAPMLIEEAVSDGADTIVAGEIRYHEFMQVLQLGLAAVEIGHYHSERPFITCMAQYLRSRLDQDNISTRVVDSRCEVPPVRYRS